MNKKLALIILMIGLFLAACGPVPTPYTPATPGGSAGHNAPVITVPPLATDQPTTTPEVFNPLPNDQRAFEAVRTYLAGKLGVDPLSISLLEAQPMDWSDSCLGLGGPAEMCAQMITPGYLIKVKAGTQIYEFHTDQGGDSIRQVP